MPHEKITDIGPQPRIGFLPPMLAIEYIEIGERVVVRLTWWQRFGMWMRQILNALAVEELVYG